MKRTRSLLTKSLLLVTLFAVYHTARSQDSLFSDIQFDSSILSKAFTFSGTVYLNPSYSRSTISHSATAEDSALFDMHQALVHQLPTTKNATDYYKLACALWELGKLKEAENMFLRIVQSKIPHYTQTYYHSSDVSNDTATRLYGYGSFTSDYKNSASLYLTKTYIEKKQFTLALQHLNNAVHKYKVVYTCGTGRFEQESQYRKLYAICYDGLHQNNKVIDLLLPSCFGWDEELITRAISRQYTASQIKAALLQAERSITCVVDTFQSSSISYTLDSNGNETNADTSWHYGSKGTIRLFGRTILMPGLYLNNGERPSRSGYVDMFKNSGIYTSLQEISQRPHTKTLH